MNEERPIVYTITAEDDTHFTIYTNDSRVSGGDAKIEHIARTKLFNTLVMISTILNNEGDGYAVTFEVD